MSIFGKKKEDEVKADNVEAQKNDEKKAVVKTSDDGDTATATAHEINIIPVITEKAHALASKGKYTFRVKKNAQKSQIKKAVQDIYNVTVEDVNVVVVKPKRRTVKYDRGYQKMFKKAVVTVKEGDHIAVFEGA